MARNKQNRRRTSERNGGVPSVKKKKEKAVEGHAFNMETFRYELAEMDPFQPTKWRLAGMDFAVRLSDNDRASQLKVSEDGLTVTGHKGYSSVRASHGVAHGAWYWEATILPPDEKADPALPDGHVRLGWSQGGCDVQVPCGYDSLSYSWRDLHGTLFHKSKGTVYPDGIYGIGDVLGFLIVLPAEPSSASLPIRSPEAVAVGVKSNAYISEKRIVDSVDLPVLPGSQLIGFKNGRCLGVMFEGLPQGRWYPSVSLYYGAKVEVNFGPSFRYPVDAWLPSLRLSQPVRAMSLAQDMYNAELTLSDLIAAVEDRLDPTAVAGDDATAQKKAKRKGK